MTVALLFQNVHQVMEAEDLLNAEDIACDLVPVPREISSQCGLSMCLEEDVFEDAMNIILPSSVTITGKYRVVNGKFEAIQEKL